MVTFEDAILIIRDSKFLPAWGDTNMIDVFTLGDELVKLLGLRVPVKIPEVGVGIDMCNAVSNELVYDRNDRVIRALSPQELKTRCLTVRDRVASLLNHSSEVCFSISLLTWHGKLLMGKTLRYRDSCGKRYTTKLRLQKYSELLSYWNREKMGPWVKFGAHLARYIPKEDWSTKCEPITNWIPKKSPYWKYP